MLGKVKLYFGIEGLKIDLDVPDSFSNNDKEINGMLRLHSKTAQRLKKLVVSLTEIYQRGRGKDKRTNEYYWGKIELNEIIDIPAHGEKIIDFRLPIEPQYSKIDSLSAKSVFHKKFGELARLVNNAKSEFVIEVSAQVEGTALNPAIKKTILNK